MRYDDGEPAFGRQSAARRRLPTRLLAVATIASLVATGVGLVSASAQLPPLFTEPSRPTTTTTTTSTTTTSTTTTTTAPAAAAEGTEPPDAPPDGDGTPSEEERVVPPEAQRVIDSVRRTSPSDNSALLAALGELEELGLSSEEAMRIGLGRFPIAGPARYTHDWLLPRWGPGFRYHLGCDVVAAYGTPVRAPVDGVATSSRDSLGGLTARVTMPDGTQFAMAHLAGLEEGFEEGMEVVTGDIIGYVGDSGNASGTPHVHLAIYPQGGPAADPKPILDEFLDEAMARLPEVIAAVRAEVVAERRARMAADTTAPLADPLAEAAEDGPPVGLIFLAGANPANGALPFLETALAGAVGAIDWSARSARAALVATWIDRVGELLSPGSW